MADMDGIQVSGLVNADDSVSVLEEAAALWSSSYPERSFSCVLSAFDAIRSLFCGEYPGYHACDTDYHDFRHTLAVFLASFRLLDGYNQVQAPLDAADAQALAIAALFHDTGYIRAAGEEAGTGARYTSCHVERSVRFVLGNAAALGINNPQGIARLIWSTGLDNEFARQTWVSQAERDAACMLASADLVGQMADRIYLEKLLFLYYEFKEAGFPGYDTEFDILRKTIGFYELTIARLDGHLGGFRSFARHHFRKRYGIDRDLYAEAMERQMAYLQDILADSSTNFRRKLKRLDLETVGARTA